METMEPILAAHPFFQGLEPRYLKLVLACASRGTFKPGQFLCRDEEARHEVLPDPSRPGGGGDLRARRGPVTIQTLGEGEVLGWLWFESPTTGTSTPGPWISPGSSAWMCSASCDKCDQDQELGYELMKRYAHYLAVQFRVTKLQLADMYGD